jgi:hypothetical protein
MEAAIPLVKVARQSPLADHEMLLVPKSPSQALPGRRVFIRIGWSSIDWPAACGRQVTDHLQSHVRDIVVNAIRNRMAQTSEPDER